MSFDREEAVERFDNFLMVMDDRLDGLDNEASARGVELDLSMEDVDRLEALFNLMTVGADKETIESLIVTFARHLGEIVRLNCGGQWTLPLGDEKSVNFNSPVILGHSTMRDLEFSPISVMRAFALRRKPGTLRKAIDADINFKPLDLSDLTEE